MTRLFNLPLPGLIVAEELEYLQNSEVELLIIMGLSRGPFQKFLEDKRL